MKNTNPGRQISTLNQGSHCIKTHTIEVFLYKEIEGLNTGMPNFRTESNSALYQGAL